MTRRLAWLVLLLSLVACRHAPAHRLSQTFLELRPSPEAVEATWWVGLEELEALLGLDSDRDGAITWAELRAQRASVARRCLRDLTLRQGELPLTPVLQDLLVDELDGVPYAVLQLRAPTRGDSESLTVTSRLLLDQDPAHRCVLRVPPHPPTVLDVGRPDVHLHLTALRRPETGAEALALCLLLAALGLWARLVVLRLEARPGWRARGPWRARSPASNPPPGRAPRAPRRAALMRWVVRVFAAGVLATLLLLGLGAPWAADWIEDRVAQELGRVFRARFEVGGIHLSLSPPGVELRRFRVLLGEREVLHSDRVEARLVRGPRGVTLSQLIIHGGRAVFLRNDEGDYSFGKVLRAETFEGEAGDVVVPGVEVYGVTLVYEDPRLAHPAELTDVSAAVRPRSDRGAYDLRISGSSPGQGRVRIEGEFRLVPRARGRFEWRLQQVETRALAHLFGELAPRFEGTVDADGTLEGLLRRPVLTGQLSSQSVDFRVDHDDGKRKLFLRDLRVRLEADGARLTLHPEVRRLGYRDPALPDDGIGLDGFAGTLSLNPEGWTCSDLAGAPDGGGRWVVEAGQWTADQVALTARVEDWPVPELLRLTQARRVEATGTLRGALTLQGDPADPAWAAELAAEAGTLGFSGGVPYRYEGLRASARGTGGRIQRVEALRADLDGSPVQVEGALDLRGPDNDLSFRVGDLSLAPLGPLLDGALVGHAGVEGRLRGPLHRPRLTGSLWAREVDYKRDRSEVDLDALSLRFDGVREPEGFRGEVSELKGRILGGARLRGGGDLRPDAGGLELEVEGLEAKRLFRALATEDVSGRGVVDLRGRVQVRPGQPPSASLQLEGPALRLYLQAGDRKLLLDLEEVSGGLDLSPKGDAYLLYLRDMKGRGFGGAVEVDGYLRVVPSLYYQLECRLTGGRAEQLSSRLVQSERFRLVGPASGTVTVRGDAGRAVVEGQAALGDSEVHMVLGDKPFVLYPDRVAGRLRITPEEVLLGPLSGNLAGGAFSARYSVDLLDPHLPWRLSAKASGLEARHFWARYLTQRHELSGLMDGDILIKGRGDDPAYLAGAGELKLTGRVGHLESLDAAEAEYGLKNLRDIEVTRAEARLIALAGRLHAKEVVLETSHGKARGDIFVEVHDGDLDGGFRVALDRKVLRGSHNLFSRLEGGRYFNLDLDVGGTLGAPKYSVRSDRLYQGALLTGAVMFSPVAVPAAILGGLRNLFRRRRRRSRSGSGTPSGSGSGAASSSGSGSGAGSGSGSGSGSGAGSSSGSSEGAAPRPPPTSGSDPSAGPR